MSQDESGAQPQDQALHSQAVVVESAPLKPVVGAFTPPVPAPAAPTSVEAAADDPPPLPIGDGGAVSPPAMWALTLLFAFVVIAATDVLLSVWPPAGTAPAQVEGVRILWGLLSLNVSINDRLMLIAILMGVIGSMIHSLTSFADYAGNRRLAKSWLPWYVVRPVIGSGLALFFYVVFRGGLLTGSSTSDINPFGIAAIGGLAGMFSKQATDKLSEVFSTMFKTSTDVGDAQRGAKLDANAPTRPVPAADGGD
jgi:hypothetical protein